MRRLIIKKIVLGDMSMKIEIPTMNGFIQIATVNLPMLIKRLKESLVDLSQFSLLMHLIMQKL